MGHMWWLYMRRWALWLGLSLALVSTLLLVACGNTTAAHPALTTQAPAVVSATPTPAPAVTPVSAIIVQMLEGPPGHYFFKPSTVTIKTGTVVVWLDSSDAPHTVTSDPNSPTAFATSSNVIEGKTFALTFNTPGTYHYRCMIHQNMTAVITVTP